MLQREHSAILSTFIKLPLSIKTFVLSIFKWPLKTGFTVILKLEESAVFFHSDIRHTFFCILESRTWSLHQYEGIGWWMIEVVQIIN